MRFITAWLVFGLLAGSEALQPHTGSPLSLRSNPASDSVQVQISATNLETLYPAHNFQVPVDHFQDDDRYAPHTNATYALRYWYDASYYVPGGPVIVLLGGETSGADRLPFLYKGILQKLSNATQGIGIVLEHRYYGKSFPVPDLSVENMRFLDVQQAMADVAYFASNVRLEGMERYTITANRTAWIAYGGSYAGAMAAFLRTVYPSVFWGAISSSGVTKPWSDFWQYWEPIRKHGPKDCIHTTQQLTQVIDGILIDRNKTHLTKKLQKAYGLEDIVNPTDFAAIIGETSIAGWQGRNWDPAENDPTFEYYCGNISGDSVIYESTEKLRSTVKDLIKASGRIKKHARKALTVRMLNWIGWLNMTLQLQLANDKSQFGQQGLEQALRRQRDTDLKNWQYRSWAWQQCTQWGCFTPSGAPKHKLPILSRTIDLAYSTQICQQAFNISVRPDLDSVWQYGGYKIDMPRLAIIDGEADPWLYMTPHAPNARSRDDTIEKPFVKLPGAVHHWDEYGLLPNETTNKLPPPYIMDIHDYEMRFVQQWLLEYQESRRQSQGSFEL